MIVNRKLSEAMWMFIATGIIMVMLAILIVVWTVALKLLVALVVLLVAHSFFYSARKIHTIRKHIS